MVLLVGSAWFLKTKAAPGAAPISARAGVPKPGAATNAPVPGSAPIPSAALRPPLSSVASSPVAAALPVPARPRAEPVPTKSRENVVGAPPPLILAPDFLDHVADAAGKVASFPLPGGRVAAGSVEILRRDAKGVVQMQGRLSAPDPGFFYFERETASGTAGTLSGHVRFDKQPLAYRVEPIGSGGSSALVVRRLDQVVCVGMPSVDPKRTQAAAGPQQAPQTHPTNIAIPGYQNGVIPLQSLPGAKAVVYLDFDGEKGPFPAWDGIYDAAPSGASNGDIKEVWQRVAEDYQEFNVNITTDRRVFDNANPTSRQHVMITPTNTAAAGAGGVALLGSFNSEGDEVCWAFYSVGKDAAEVISHEVGHTFGLSHDGRDFTDGTPHEEYNAGQGDDDTGWAPIMGASYYKNLSQWSKGEYKNANNFEDDIAVIANNNNDTGFRADDYGASLDTAGYLEILADNSVSNEGIIETRTDVDAFRFVSAGGAVSLTVNPVNPGPNIDILAEIYNGANGLVASSNPVNQINATVSATLPAGEYTLRVSGVGKGDPLDSGYTDYASLGAYLISGTANGGVKPDRFTIPENTPRGAVVGTVTKRKNHAGNALTYAIASGNLGGAFTIDANTGVLSVESPGPLNFETLSTRWDDPATISLFVTITDPANPSLSESVRVVVTVADVNEAPTITAESGVVMFSHSQIGTEISAVRGADEDHFDYPLYSIVSGNPGGVFAVDPVTGKLTVRADINVGASTSYPLLVRATDQGNPARSTDATITITVLPAPAGYSPGTVAQAFFEGINGSAVANLTGAAKYPNQPDSLAYLTSFDAGTHGDNYGSLLRGYVIPPATGSYTFWLASDDSSELRLSSNATVGAATLRASVSGYTDRDQFNRFPSQTSAAVTLTAGTPYYVEVRHKQGDGGNFVQVAWQGPGIAQQVIPGRFLAPFYQNYAPKVPAQTFSVRRGAYVGTTVGTTAVTDLNPGETAGSFAILGGTGAGFLGVDAPTGRIFVKDAALLNAAAANSCTLTVRATDSGTPALQGSGTITVNLVDTAAVTATGIVQQIWTGITGTKIAALTADARYPARPSATRALAILDTGAEYGDDYGSRMRAYVVPPTSGAYRFYLSSDDDGQLLFTPGDPTTAPVIASVTGYTTPDTWTTQASQTSAVFTLTGGQRYYLEVLFKQGNGGNFAQVAWTGPGIANPTVIPASALRPFDVNVAPTWTGTPYSFTVSSGASAGATVGTVSATDPEGATLTYAFLAGNGDGAFAIDAATGAITVADAAKLPSKATSLTVGAQDAGGDYPQKAVVTTVSINVTTTFAQWRQMKFGANAGNNAISGPTADPDNDGLSNLIEYAIGTEPLTRDLNAYTVDLETVNGQRYLRMSVTKNPAATEATLKIQVNGNISTGSWSIAGTVTEINTATSLVVRDYISVGSSGARFIRLSVSSP